MKFDIDVSGMQAGSTIGQAICEHVIGFKRDGFRYEFQFAIMTLADHVQKLLWKEGKRFTVVTRNGQIEVLTHEQASKYNADRFNLAIAKMRRAHKRMVCVDVGGISPELRERHDLNIARQSRILQGMKSKDSDVTPTAHKTSVPKRTVKLA